MVNYYEKRSDPRIIHKSPIKVEDIKAGKTYRARMVNYSKNGLYFETNLPLESVTEVSIEMEDSPQESSALDLKGRYGAEIMWHMKLEDSLYNYGYGVKFIPSSGKITNLSLPGGLGVRVDTALYSGYTIPSQYDSLIAKLIVHGRDRTEALMKMKCSLSEFIIEGVKTTIPFHKKVLDNQDFIDGNFDTHFVEKTNSIGHINK